MESQHRRNWISKLRPEPAPGSAVHPADPGDRHAEARTAEIARKLTNRGWVVISDVAEGCGITHVLVGPGGVFALASPPAEGSGARVRDGVLWTRRAHDPRTEKPGLSVNRQILDASRFLHREIRARTARGPAVHPVVVLWCEFPQRIAESSRIAFIHGKALPSWLAARPAELDEVAIRDIAAAVEAIPGEHYRRHLRVPHPRLRVPSRGRRSVAR